jgi:CBS domain containing-hemolysin-like protein
LRRQNDYAGLDPAELLREREQSGETIERNQKDMIVKAASFDRLSVRDVMVPRADTRELDMSVDEALKYVVSMGVVIPTDRNPPIAPDVAPLSIPKA